MQDLLHKQQRKVSLTFSARLSSTAIGITRLSCQATSTFLSLPFYISAISSSRRPRSSCCARYPPANSFKSQTITLSVPRHRRKVLRSSIFCGPRETEGSSSACCWFRNDYLLRSILNAIIEDRAPRQYFWFAWRTECDVCWRPDVRRTWSPKTWRGSAAWARYISSAPLGIRCRTTILVPWYSRLQRFTISRLMKNQVKFKLVQHILDRALHNHTFDKTLKNVVMV